MNEEVKYVYITLNTVTRINRICGIDAKVSTIANKTLGTTIINRIYNGTSGKFYTQDAKSTPIKLGKILSTITTLDSTEIETAVSKWKSHYDVDTSSVQISSDITEVYDISKVGGSCMYGKDMRILEDVGTEVAYILDDNDMLLARALVWDSNIISLDGEDTIGKCYDRIFFENEIDKITLIRYFKDNGYTDLCENEWRTLKSTKESYDSVPYIDNMRYLTSAMYLSTDNVDAIDTLQETDGSSSSNSGISDANNEDKVYCADSENYVHMDDVYWCEDELEYYEFEHNLVRIADEYYHRDSDSICYTDDTGNYILVDDAYVLANEEMYEHTDELVLIDYELYHCEDEDIAYCEESMEWDFRNNLWEHTDGTWHDHEEETEDEVA